MRFTKEELELLSGCIAEVYCKARDENKTYFIDNHLETLISVNKKVNQLHLEIGNRVQYNENMKV